MSGKFMKGFLIFAVVFFFVVVGLVGLTVVMKRHENAQIAEENKTLVAPDPQKIQRLVDRIKFDDKMDNNEKQRARKGVAAFLRACPRIINLTKDDEQYSIGRADTMPEFDGTSAHFYVAGHLTNDSLRNLPHDLKQAEGYAVFGIAGGTTPGVYILWPFSRWLCNVPSKMTYQEMNDALDKKEVTYKDLMQFIPFKDIPPNSF